MYCHRPAGNGSAVQRQMTESDFQDELRQLKLRLAKLTADSQRRLTRNSAVKYPTEPQERLHSVHGSTGLPVGRLDYSSRILVEPTDTERHFMPPVGQPALVAPGRAPAMDAFSRRDGTNLDMPPSFNSDQIQPPLRNNMTLPSGPIFWQLISALKMDVRQIDGRVANLERSYEDLEERVEALEPRKFTPEGSVESDVDGFVGVRGSEDAIADAFSGSDMFTMCAAPQPPPLSGAFGQTQTVPDPWNDAGVYARPADPRMPVSSRSHAMHTARVDKYAQTFTLDEETPTNLSSGVNFRDREIAKLDDLLKDATETNRSQEEQLTFKDDKIADLELRLQNSQTTAATWENISHELQDELAERKQQIDEAYDDNAYLHAQLSTKCTEMSDLTAHHEDAIARLSYDRSEFAHSCRRGQELLQEHNTNLEQSLKARDDHIASLEYAAEAQSHDIVALQQASEAFEEQITSLNAFCEQKDAIFHQQQAIIARGQELLEARDREDDASRVRAEDADAAFQRQRARHEELGSILSKTHAELAALKAQRVRDEKVSRSRDAHVEMLRTENDKFRYEIAGLKDVIRGEKRSQKHSDETARDKSVPTPRSMVEAEHRSEPTGQGKERIATIDDPRVDVSDTQDVSQSSEPFAHAIKVMKDGTLRREIPWAPRSIRGYSRLPHEEARAQVWAPKGLEAPRQRTPHQFGVASPLNSRRDMSSTHRREDTSEEALPRSRSHRDDAYRHRAARHLYGRSDDLSASEGTTERRSRRKLPLDATLLPPLPAPVEPARMESMPDLRAAPRERRQRAERYVGLSRHASMAEMPKRRLQAYVETEEEGETRRERDGSLLD